MPVSPSQLKEADCSRSEAKKNSVALSSSDFCEVTVGAKLRESVDWGVFSAPQLRRSGTVIPNTLRCKRQFLGLDRFFISSSILQVLALIAGKAINNQAWVEFVKVAFI
jgi:hypothetical protein